MNKKWILQQLREAHEELTRIISELESDLEYCEGDLYVALAHLYGHVNTAWNARNFRHGEGSCLLVEEFDAWRKFPKDIDLD